MVTRVFYSITEVGGELVHSWQDGPVNLTMGKSYQFFGPIPDLPDLAPGDYELMIRMRGMSGWISRSTVFSIGN